MNPIITELKDYLLSLNKENILGIYSYGSYQLGGLQANSDLDIMVISKESVSFDFRNQLTSKLLELSGTIEDPNRRCIELSIFNVEDLKLDSFPIRCDYMYGEWLREELLVNPQIDPFRDEDNLIVLWTAQETSLVIYGEELMNLSRRIPISFVKESILKSYRDLTQNIKGDETNVILTLCRMWYTLKYDKIARKDEAAKNILMFLDDENIKQARNEYLGIKCSTNSYENLESTVSLLLSFISFYDNVK